MIIIGVDTGGTFTDFVFRKDDHWEVRKLLSTPDNPAAAVLTGLQHIGWDGNKKIVHGSTVATNAILERKGARTALITNRGFEDVIEIGRQNRSRLYDLAYRKEPHIVPPVLRFGLRGRILHTGEEHEPLDVEEARQVVSLLEQSQVESVAVCFVFSFVNPVHEKEIKALLQASAVPVSLSHEILAEFREFERTSTTVLNAYVSPKMHAYVGHLLSSMAEQDSLCIMQSNGGSISAGTAMKESVRTILSGPAGGVVGALEIGKAAGCRRLITFDMGGTSTDVSLIDESLSFTMESEIAGYPIKVPMIDIHTVGAGGGSIASVDVGGSLKVGPESAGADPGPICYGKGEQITVTDANLYLGRLVPEHFLGGSMKLQEEKLQGFFQKLAKEAGLSELELAEGILAVANAAMEKAVRIMSVEKGYDPREFVFFSFGGAGGMHAPFLARLLSIPRVVVPQNPGILSALGMIMADVVKDYSHTIMRNQLDSTAEELAALFVDLEKRGLADLSREGIGAENATLERYLDMRYQGQSHEIVVPFDDDFIEGFHSLHEKTYGYRYEDRLVEIVNIRLRARGVPAKPKLQRVKKVHEQPPEAARLGERKVVFEQKVYETQIMARDRLLGGNRIPGPAILVEYSSTIVIPPFAEAAVDEYGNLLIEILDQH
ncbi:MAG: hydantoinase/oxoprolinase family protein [Deltaproteobacteria bacterium]|nr:hydantoinase/oxoprolinase family protein [Deltaproteobacteria bacterium]MBW2071869.1 hydantoinase/oxoprolinase family protein [Deltaproteobacteria bacterium]